MTHFQKGMQKNTQEVERVGPLQKTAENLLGAAQSEMESKCIQKTIYNSKTVGLCEHKLFDIHEVLNLMPYMGDEDSD